MRGARARACTYSHTRVAEIQKKSGRLILNNAQVKTGAAVTLRKKSKITILARTPTLNQTLMLILTQTPNPTKTLTIFEK